MKKFLLLTIFLVSLSFLISSVKAQDIFKVEWNLVEDGIIHKCYEIKIQNLDSVKHFFNLTAFFSNTNFPLEEMKNIMFYEWTTVPKDFPVYGNVWTGCDYAYYSNMTEFTLPSNCEWCNSTPEEPAYYKCLINTVIGHETKNVADWSEAKMKVFKVLTTGEGELRGNSGNMNIPKYRSYEYDDFGNIVIENGAKKFKLCFDAPIVFQNDQWGSSGKVGIRDENGNYEEDPWWNSTWLRRKKIIINNTQNPNDLIDYQVAINLTYDSDMQPDFSDLRFTWYNSTDGSEIEIPYWVESKVDSSRAYIWVKVKQIPASSYATIYLYYGNTSVVSSQSNPDLTFEFYDDFNDNYLSPDKWLVLNGTWVEQNQRLEYSGSNPNRLDRIITKNFVTNISNPIIIYGKVYWVSGSSFEQAICWYANDTTPLYSYGTFLSKFDYTHRITKFYHDVRLAQRYYDPVTGVWYSFQIIVNGSIFKSKLLNDGGEITGSDTTYTSGYLQLYSWTPTFENAYYDDIRVRKYTDPEPTYSIGTEEMLLPSITIFSPLNQSYYGSIDFVFKVIDYSVENFTVKAYLNNQLEYENTSYQNDTQISYSKTLPIGTYNFTVYAEDSYGASSQQEVIFTSLGYCGDNICQADYENNMNCFKDCGGTARQFTVGIGSVVLAFGGLMLLATAFASSPTEGKDYVFKVFIAVIGIILMVYGIIYLINL